MSCLSSLSISSSTFGASAYGSGRVLKHRGLESFANSNHEQDPVLSWSEDSGYPVQAQKVGLLVAADNEDWEIE